MCTARLKRTEVTRTRSNTVEPRRAMAPLTRAAVLRRARAPALSCRPRLRQAVAAAPTRTAQRVRFATGRAALRSELEAFAQNETRATPRLVEHALVVSYCKSPGPLAPPHLAEEVAGEELFFLHRCVNQLFLWGEISASREAIHLLIQCSMLEFEIAHAPVRHRIHFLPPPAATAFRAATWRQRLRLKIWC